MKNERSNNIFLNEGINVLSLFDGMSCGQIALDKLGIKVNNYFASEIDKHAIKVTQINFPNTIQLGDVTKVKIKLLCLSEVYSYICNYDCNLQSNIPEWEVLYWLDKDFTFSAKIGTQKPNERQEAKSSTIQRIEEVWFSNRKMGSVRKSEYNIECRDDKERNNIETPPKLQCGDWWYDNDVYRRYKKENIGITIRETQNRDSEKKNFGNIERVVFKRRKTESCFRENEKSNAGKKYSGELFGGEEEYRFPREVDKEKRDGRKKEISFIDNVVGKLCRWDAVDGIAQNYWNILRLHKEEQITVVECEYGFYIFKGRIALLCGGSPCQGFSFAGKQLSFEDPRSKLFFEFVRLLKETKPKYFLLENVRMKKSSQNIISKYLGVEPIEINSNLVSAQNRRRLYWTNIPNIKQPNDKRILLMNIIIDSTIDCQMTTKDKVNAITASYGGAVTWNNIDNKQQTIILDAVNGKKVHIDLFKEVPYTFYETRTEDGKKARRKIRMETGRDSTPRNKKFKMYAPSKEQKANCLVTVESPIDYIVDTAWKYRKLYSIEIERLQTVPDGYTSIVSDSQARKMLGNGWTVDIIVHIFSQMMRV